MAGAAGRDMKRQPPGLAAPDCPDQNRIKTKSPSGLPGSNPDYRETKERIKPDEPRMKPGSIGSPPYKGVIDPDSDPADPGRLEGWPPPLAPADLQALAPTPATLEGLRLRPADLARLVGGKPDA